jgi:hypothetical protein
MNIRKNTATLRQRTLLGADGNERLMADIITCVCRLSAGTKVTEGDCHLARLKVFLGDYADRQGADFELGDRL